MTNENSQGKRWILAGGIAAAGFFIIVGMVAVYLLTPLGKPVPTVEILQPAEALGIQSGQGVTLTARGKAQNGVQYIHFLVDDVPVAQHTASAENTEILEAAFSWFSSRPGIHKLSVVAYSAADIASEPQSVLVVVHPRAVVEGQQAGQASVAQGDESQQSDGTAGDAQGQDQQGQDQQGQGQNDQGPDGQAPGGQQPGADEVVGLGVLGVGQLIEHISLEEHFPIDLPGQPGDMPPEIISFNVAAQRGGSGVHADYRVAAADDVGLVRVVVTASSLDNPAMLDRMQYICGGQQSCVHMDSISLTEGGWLLTVQAVDTSGQVSPMLSREVHVLAGDDPPAIAEGNPGVENLPDLDDPVIDPGGDNPWDDIGIPEIAEYHCTMREIVFDVPYTYGSDNGNQVQLWVLAHSGGEKIASGFVTVEHGSSVARVKMELVDPAQEATSDELSFFYLTLEGENVYSERIERQMRWPKPLPDLKMAEVTRLWAEESGELVFDVQNMGCASVDGFDLKVFRQDGYSFTSSFDVSIAEKETKRVTIPIGEDINQYGRMFWIQLDPDDVIDEINEENNQFIKPQIMLKFVHIHSIKMNHTSDGEWHQDDDEGEFYLYFLANEDRAHRPQVDGMRWVLSPGTYEIGGAFMAPVYLSPNLNWDSYMLVEVMVREHDDIGSDDDACWIKYVHKPDMSDPSSWKGGGEFFMEDGNKCTVYWSVEVE